MKRLALLVALSTVVAFLAPVAAQNAPAEYIAVTTVTVRPGGFADFEDYVKKINAAAMKIGLKVRVGAYQAVRGGSPFQFDFVSEHQSLAELDSVPNVAAILTKAHGDVEGGKILRAGRATIESVEYMVVRYRAEFSTKPRPVAGSAFFQLVRTEIDPAMAPAYEDYLRKAKEAGDKFAAAPTAFRHTNTFGQGFVYISALPFNTWADRAKWPTPQAALVAAYGEAEASKLGEITRRATKRQDIWVVQYRRDLSRIPAGATN